MSLSKDQILNARDKGMSVGELLATHNSRELAEYEALYRIEPWGEYRQDLRFAMLCCLIANALKDIAGGKGRRFKMEDFMLFEDRKPKTAEDLKSALQRMCEL